MTPRQIVVRGLFVGIGLTVSSVAALFLYVSWYSATDRLVPGVNVGGTQVGGLKRSEAKERLAIPGTGGGLVGRVTGPTQLGLTSITDVSGSDGPSLATASLRHGDQVWPLDLKEVGAVPDVVGALQRAAQIGRDGTMVNRVFLFLSGIVHGHFVPAPAKLRQEVLVSRLEMISRELERSPVNAVYDFETDTVHEDVAGQALDIEASLTAARQGLLEGKRTIDLIVKPVPAQVKVQDLADVRRYLVARFATPILVADAGRVQNITLSARKISGMVVRPGQLFSFNEIVGPRDALHGWAQAKELYQGEFVMGYGGGICQVSSTLYNSVLLAGLEIKQRYHHDRPLQYIDPGRDATVAWNLLDFQFRNNTDVPIMVGARVLPGSPQQIEVTLHAPRPLLSAHVEDSVIRYFPPDLEEIVDPALPPNAREVIDEGSYGIEVKIFRVVGTGEGTQRELVSHDHYQPKAGKVKVGKASTNLPDGNTSAP